MKIALHLALVAVIAAPLLCPLSVATTTADGKAQQNGRPASPSANHDQVSKTNHPRHSLKVLTPRRPQVSPQNPRHLAEAQSASAARSATRANGVPIVSKGVTTSRSAQLWPGPRNSLASGNARRHHSANPAVLGGSKTPTAANTGTINGARMSRRP